MSLLEFNPGLIIWTIVTFIILLVVLRRVAWKPLLNLLEERERTVRESLEGAEKARREAEDLTRRNQETLEEFRRQSDEILARRRSEAERLRAEILEKARKEAERVLAEGKKQLDREHRAALKELRSVVAELSIGAAERILSTTLDREKQRRLVEEYLRSLPEAQDGPARRT